MKSILHQAHSRGHADYGWLKTYHTFSFSSYYNSDRMNFGAIRVLNDDTVVGGMGFNTHPHRDMEIISIPLSGALEHKDNMGNHGVIEAGEVQVMSAGTGIQHSEFNRHKYQDMAFLQIWIIPNKAGVEPRYDQKPIPRGIKGQWTTLISPNKNGESLWIHQEAWFYKADLGKGKTLNYPWNKTGNGVYAFLLNGHVKVGGNELGKRDGIGLWDTDSIDFESVEDSEILLMEVPLLK